MNLENLSPTELLSLYAKIMEELRDRGVVRTSNNPTGDLAEYIFCKAFGWSQEGNSKANFDAVDKDDVRYQIKGRRMTRHNRSRQLSAIRDLEGEHFDILAGVLFAEDYSVLRAILIPRKIVVARSKFVKHTNSHKFLLQDEVWEISGVTDVTEKLREIEI